MLPRHGQGQAVSTNWRNLRLSDFTQFHTEFIDAGGVIDNGDEGGWSIPLLGGPGMSVASPLDGWHAIGPPIERDQAGAVIHDLAEWEMRIGAHVVDDSGPFGAADIDFVVGLVNSDVAASTDGLTFGMRYTGTSRMGMGWRLIGGGASLLSGSVQEPPRRWHSVMARTWGSLNSARTYFLKDDGTGATGVGPQCAMHNDSGWNGDVRPRPFVACLRTSDTDLTTRVGVWQPVRSAVVQHANP